MSEFILHSQLVKDCHFIWQNNNAYLLLHKNAEVPWFIVVPKTEQQDLFDLSSDKQHKVLSTCQKVKCFIQKYFDLEKINFAAIGNIVPQLHLHLIGRHVDDACWPAPVWGHLTAEKKYTEEQVQAIVVAIKSVMSKDFNGDEA